MHSEQTTKRNYKRWLVLVALVLGAINAWASRHTMNPDGISYIEIAQAYVRGDFVAALSAWWSPLYSWLIALVLWVVQPSAYWEFTFVHALNFMIYAGALLAFHFFLKELLRYRGPDAQGLPDWALEVLGYALFIISSLGLVTLTIVTPDLLVVAFVYLVSALALRAARTHSWASYALLGASLGLGYLAKTPVLFVAVLFFAPLLFLKKDFSKIALAVFVCLVFVAPYVVAVSRAKGYLTIGESGPVNYAWYTTARATHIHWQGDPVRGTPRHPTRKTFDSPAIYEFATPVSGSYPPWYDPSYWNEGIAAPFSIRGQLGAIRENVREFYQIFSTVHISLITVVLVLLFAGWHLRRADLKKYTLLLIPAVGALGMYGAVLVRDRYTAPFVTLLWMGILVSLQNKESPHERMTRGVVWAGAFMMLVSAAVSYIPDIYRTTRDDVVGAYPVSHAQWQVSQELHKLGINSGDRVAFVGHEQSGLSAYWAHLAGVKIVAEIPSGEDAAFWAGGDKPREEVYKKFSETGARAAVSEYMPPGTVHEGWQKLAETGYFFYQLAQ